MLQLNLQVRWWKAASRRERLLVDVLYFFRCKTGTMSKFAQVAGQSVTLTTVVTS